MNRASLLRLRAAVDRTAESLRDSDPVLYNELASYAESRARDALVASLPFVTPAVRGRLASVTLTPGAEGGIRRAAIEAIRADLSERDVRKVEARLAAADLPNDPLPSGTRLGENPLLRPLLARAGLHVLGDLSAVGEAAVEIVADRAPTIGAVDHDTLDALVQANTITEADARALGQAVSFYNLLDGDVTLVRAARAAARAVPELAALDAGRWVQLLNGANLTPPGDLTREAYAADLAQRVGSAVPARGLTARLSAHAPDTLGGALPIVRRIQQQNANVELMHLDYSRGSADVRSLAMSGLAPADVARGLSALKAMQRMYAVTDDVDGAAALIAAGYTSAHAVASTSPRKLASKTNVDYAKANAYRTKALSKTGETTALMGAVADYMYGGFKETNVNNTQSSVDDFLTKLDGLEEMFGSLTGCRCEHCASIFSPAAYFVDLMRFVEEHVVDEYFAGQKSTHELNLKVRRPDLWTLPLTCENTLERIPTLDIVNEVMENDVARRLGYAGPLTDRGAVEAVVYAQALATKVDSFHQPFLLPLERLNTYLRHFDLGRGDVARGVGATSDVVAAAELEISATERGVLTTAISDITALGHLYGIQFQPAGNEIAAFDAQLLLASMHLSRAELGDLFASAFVSGGGAPATIQAEKKDADSVQNDIERVHDLTAAMLDRMHRFTRLRRRVPWSIGELDLVLSHIGDPALTAATLAIVARLHRLQQRLGGSVEELCARFGPIPQAAVSASRKPLFDRLFNVPLFVQAGGAFPQPATNYVHPAFRLTPLSAADHITPRLLAGLRVSDEDLQRLIRYLAAALGADLQSSNESSRAFALSAANLSLLYRHASLAAALKLKVDDLFQLASHAGMPNGISALPDLETLLDTHGWWKTSGYTLDGVGLVTGGVVLKPEAFADGGDLAAQIVDVVEAEESLTFAETVFAFGGGVTEQQSRQIVNANIGPLEPVAGAGDRYRLASDFDAATPLIIPSGIPISGAAARDVLLAYHARTILPPRIAARLGVEMSKAEALVAIAKGDLGSEAVVRVLHRLDPPTAVAALLERAVMLNVLFRPAVFDAAALEFIRSHAAIFGIANFEAVDLAAIRKLSVYARMTDKTALARYGAGTTVDPADVQVVLAGFDPAQKFAAVNLDQLVRVVHAVPGLVATVLSHVAFPDTAPEALDRLARAIDMAQRIGISGEALARIASEDYASLAGGADAVLAAFRAKYADEREYRDKIDPFEDRIRSRKRDALVDHLIYSVTPQFTERSDLYHYFLIDVEVDGCVRTSRVVASISTVQLYVHRILMNLEQDTRPLSDPTHVHVEPSSIPSVEWTWRKAYRLWEANRKVFLFPETYIEPELRDDKTPIFEALEDELLQQDIDDQSVLDAYAKYLGGFDEVAALSIAGAVHDISASDQRDVLHLFGAAAGDPPAYYHRTVENAYYGVVKADRGVVWGPWRPLNVQIPVRRVGPVIHDGRLHLFWTQISTRPHNKVEGGGSNFVGYRHTMTLKQTSLRLDRRWTPPQEFALPSDYPFENGPGVIIDELDSNGVPAYGSETHDEPRDDYTLTGRSWEEVYPDVEPDGGIRLTARNFVLFGTVLLFERGIYGYSLHDDPGPDIPLLCEKQGDLFYGYPAYSYGTTSGFANMILDDGRIDAFNAEYATEDVKQGLYVEKIAGLDSDSDVTAINGSIEDAIVQVGPDALILQGSVRPGALYRLQRIGTTVGTAVGKQLFVAGVDGLLDLEFQQELSEDPVPITLTGTRIQNATKTDAIDFTGPYGVYFREIFFHIPFLIANHLNSQQRFAAAQRWYHYIFNPTANEPLPSNLTPQEKAQALRDRRWRYLEFRGLDLPKLKEVLTDKQAIEIYKKDPFNPHAIARLRLSAYQKAVVMKYIDNLLDWGDDLFARFTPESTNEATLLYVMAADLLGDRPVEVGECGHKGVEPWDYEHIGPLLEKGSGFVEELETQGGAKPQSWKFKGFEYVVQGPKKEPSKKKGAQQKKGAQKAKDGVSMATSWASTQIVSWGGESKQDAKKPGAKKGAAADKSAAKSQDALVTDHSASAAAAAYLLPWFGKSLLQASAVFCIPFNPELLAYWDRVEDRLFKVRHCMDITGARREMPLFAPEIDPRLLVRMKAAGLSLEDVLAATSGSLPPYRFAHVIERAKGHAAALQGFGAALLSALEKKDAEELNRLRAIHQQHLLRLTKEVRTQEINAADQAIQALDAQKVLVTHRREFYEALIETGLIPWEHLQAVSRVVASTLLAGAGVIDTVAAIMYLVPQVGSPFALKYGGKESGDSGTTWSEVMRTAAGVADVTSAAAGLMAGFQRREEGWDQQVTAAIDELAQIERNLEAARIAKIIAEKSLLIHERTIDQAEEVFDFFSEKFSNLGRYTYLSTTLQRLFREAYNGAYSMARLAQEAYRFERGEDAAVFLQPSYWNASQAGLLAGEQLLIDLQTLERRFIETNVRTLEIDQSFSLMQIDPAALLRLRETGECAFTIGEFHCDLFYPGHYRRKIKGVRVTIPCITGPFTNVSGTLRLNKSFVRKDPKLGAANLAELPPRRSVAIATSTAQNDGGVFEMSFRDERYMPFEGAGAISQWHLSLPRAFRQFDYQTINDVIVSITYTALDDGVLRDQVELQNEAIEGTLLHYATTEPLRRVFSLRQDFSSAFQRLLFSAPGTAVAVDITDKYLPFFLKDRPIAVTKARLAVKVAKTQVTAGLQLSLDGQVQSGFSASTELGGLDSVDVSALFSAGLLDTHAFSVVNAGQLAPTPLNSGDIAALDADKLLDLLLYVEYTLAP